MTNEEKRKKRKKQQEDWLEAFIISVMQKSMKQALDAAMDELFKDWK